MFKKKSKTKIAILFFIVFFLIIMVIGIFLSHNMSHTAKPFEDLTVEQVKNISLYSVTKEIIYTFNDTEKQTIINLLNNIEIGEEDNREYDGGFDSEFRLEKSDGTIIEFGTNANFVYNGQRYEVPENNISLIELRNLHTEYYKKYYISANANK